MNFYINHLASKIQKLKKEKETFITWVYVSNLGWNT